MVGNSEHDVAELLKQVKDRMVTLSTRYAGEEGNWDKAQFLMESARQVDEIRHRLSNGRTPSAPRQTCQPPKRPRSELPYYYVEGDRLAKDGPSRDGSTYTHRVTRANYEQILAALKEIAESHSTFETQRLVDRCNVPKHEPLLVVDMLRKQGALEKLRRGRWQFVDAKNFEYQADNAWSRLPRG